MTWTIERWGTGGRPIVILTDPAVDRSHWWPAAAQLADENTVLVLLPPPNFSAVTAHAHLDDIGLLVAHTVARAPVVVGHHDTVALAVEFGVRFATHAVATRGADMPLGDLVAYLRLLAR